MCKVKRRILLCLLLTSYEDCERSWFEEEQPAHRIILDDFWFDRTEVTNSQFAAFLNERGNQEEGGETWLNVDGEDCRIENREGRFQPANGYEDHPVVEVTWYGAAAYCEWAGGRLPTEAEWEYAARGPEGYEYPWGDTFDGTRLNYCDVNCGHSNLSDTDYDDGYAETAPVGSYPDGTSWCGTLDMAGNVWEWVADWYEPYTSGEQVNPEGPSSGYFRVVRGGSWNYDQRRARCTYRRRNHPYFSRPNLGFRCAEDSE